MTMTRWFHTCSAFTLGNSVIGIVVGGEEAQPQKSVEYINFDEDNPRWKSGPDLPRTFEMKGHQMVSNGQNVFYINTISKDIFRLECSSTMISTCQWTELQQKLQYSRKMSVALLVPDGLTECS